MPSGKIKFWKDCRGFHHGQTDVTLYVETDGVYAGHIDYCLFEGEVHIEFFQVDEQFRRQGFGTALYHRLRHEEKGKLIHWGMLTDEGALFLESLDRGPQLNFSTK